MLFFSMERRAEFAGHTEKMGTRTRMIEETMGSVNMLGFSYSDI